MVRLRATVITNGRGRTAGAHDAAQQQHAAAGAGAQPLMPGVGYPSDASDG